MRHWMIVIAALAACSSSKDRQSAGSGSARDAGVTVKGPVRLPSMKHYTPDQVVRIPSPPIVLPKQESFRLLDPGKGARQVIRYVLAAGVVEYRNETKLSSRQLDDKGVFDNPVAMPPIRDGFAITVAADRPGTLALRVLPGEIGGTQTPAAEQYIAAWKKRLEGRRITVTVDPRGQLGTISFNDDPTAKTSGVAKDELAQRLLAVMVPFPAEPIAPGASWQVTTILRQGPAYVKQTATYTLGPKTATGWQVHVKILRVAEQQLVEDPALPKDAVAELLAMFRLFEGDVTVDPRRPLVDGGSLSIESRVHAKIQLPGQPPIEQYLEETGTVTFSATVAK